jgi:hypothetical protein
MRLTYFSEAGPRVRILIPASFHDPNYRLRAPRSNNGANVLGKDRFAEWHLVLSGLNIRNFVAEYLIKHDSVAVCMCVCMCVCARDVCEHY